MGFDVSQLGFWCCVTAGGRWSSVAVELGCWGKCFGVGSQLDFGVWFTAGLWWFNHIGAIVFSHNWALVLVHSCGPNNSWGLLSGHSWVLVFSHSWGFGIESQYMWCNFFLTTNKTNKTITHQYVRKSPFRAHLLSSSGSVDTASKSCTRGGYTHPCSCTTDNNKKTKKKTYFGRAYGHRSQNRRGGR